MPDRLFTGAAEERQIVADALRQVASQLDDSLYWFNDGEDRDSVRRRNALRRSLADRIETEASPPPAAP